MGHGLLYEKWWDYKVVMNSKSMTWTVFENEILISFDFLWFSLIFFDGILIFFDFLWFSSMEFWFLWFSSMEFRFFLFSLIFFDFFRPDFHRKNFGQTPRCSTTKWHCGSLLKPTPAKWALKSLIYWHTSRVHGKIPPFRQLWLKQPQWMWLNLVTGAYWPRTFRHLPQSPLAGALTPAGVELSLGHSKTVSDHPIMPSCSPRIKEGKIF